jgi:hypothetical protein
MRKVLLAGVAVLSGLSASAANAADVLVALLLKKDGKVEVHYQTIQGNCAQLLTGWREQAQQGLSIELTFRAPPEVTGKVLEATCILPNGSIGEQFKAPDVPAI